MKIDFNKHKGLAPVIVQDFTTGEVLMLGFMNTAALQATLATGEVTFYSRSRKGLWKKGEQSGHRLRLRELRVDCDCDALLARVDVLGPGVCHAGYRSCFYRRMKSDGSVVAASKRVFDPDRAYRKEKKA